MAFWFLKRWWWALLLLFFFDVVHPIRGRQHAWERPGCYKVGHTRRISIPGCVEFDITTNACRGYCESYSVPSAEDILRINSKHVITSYGQCCNIVETEDVRVKVMCLEGPKDLVFKSARTCSCYHCKKD